MRRTRRMSKWGGTTTGASERLEVETLGISNRCVEVEIEM